ncbi:MAG: AzlD domain-containing protein [Oscillospiraceae bacterium]|jgi:branched-subunit amino acid transport protein AzlD|nr:AzlD domain-containing protein [Oscillospiraceae bacterium]
MTNGQILLTIIIMSVCTIATRAVPFILLKTKPQAGDSNIGIAAYLGRSLPYASIGMLVVYCLKDTQFASAAGFAPQVLGVLATAAVYLLTNKSLAAIIGGTAVYMVCLRVF